MTLIRCSECGHSVSDKAERCPNCGCPIEKKIYCEECGQVLSEMDKTCPNCGCPIEIGKNENNTDSIISESKVNKKHYSVAVPAIVGIVFYLVISVLCSNLLNKGITTTDIRISNDIFFCGITAVITTAIIAKSNLDRMVYAVVISVVSTITYCNWESLGYGTAFIVFLTEITLIIVSAIKRNHPTRVKGPHKTEKKFAIYSILCFILFFSLRFSTKDEKDETINESISLEKENVKESDSLTRVVAAEQARKDSINAVKAIRQKFVRFADVYVNLSNSDTEHINKNLLEVLKSRGYEVLHKDEKSEYHETYDETFNYKHYYLGINMEYHGYWNATGQPCNGVEFLISDMPSASAIIHFENSYDLEAFLKDAGKAGFRKDDYGWSRESEEPYDDIKKIDDTTLECNSTMSY